MTRGRSRSFVASLVLALLGLASGCASDHSALERKDVASASTTSGAGGGSATGSVSATSGAGGAPSEPDVPTQLIFVNGVVDEPAVRFCFVPHPAGPSSEKPWPSAAGLGFARAAELDLATLALDGQDLEVRAILGSAAAVGDKSCAALASASGVRVATLALVPGSVLEAKRRLVFVAHGCAGGPGREDPSQSFACGTGYAFDASTLGLVAAARSSLGADDALRIQALHAVSGLEAPAKVSVSPGLETLAYQSIEGAWTLGALAPSPPFDALSVAGLANLASARVAVSGSAGTAELLLSDALANGGVAPASLVDGDGLTLVGVGAAPGIPEGAWIRPFSLVALRTPK